MMWLSMFGVVFCGGFMCVFVCLCVRVCVLVCALVFSFCLYVCGCLCASVGVHMVWDAHGVYECAWGGMCGSLWWVNWLDVRVVF